MNAPPRAVHHPRRQRPGPQQGEVRAHCLGARSPGSPHLRRRDNVQVILFWQLLISTMCAYLRHTFRQKYLIVDVVKILSIGQS